MYLKVVGEGVEDADVLGAELQADGTLHKQREALMPHVAVALYHHHTCDRLLQHIGTGRCVTLLYYIAIILYSIRRPCSLCCWDYICNLYIFIKLTPS